MTARTDFQEAYALMKAMGSTSGFDPIPPDQHKWQMAAGEDPLHRIWSWLCAHTIHWGHRSPYAISKEGDELHLENIATDLGMDEANVRRYWREGLEKGIWRGGTRAEGTRRLYLAGKTPPPKNVTLVNEKECTDFSERRINNLPTHIRKQIVDWDTSRQQALADEFAREDELEERTFATLQAATRNIIGQRKDNVCTRHGVKWDRQEHTKKTETPEEAAARRGRVQPILPFLESFVQTISTSVQTEETSLYNPSAESVQPTSADRILIEKSLPEKTRASASSSILNASHPRAVDQGLDGEKPVNELYAPGKPDAAAKRVTTSPKPTQAQNPKQAAAETEAAGQIAKALDLDLDAGRQIVSGCRALDSRITPREMIGLAHAKLKQVRQQIRDGKVNIPGYLITAVPKAALGGLRDSIREKVQRDIEKDLDYARLVADDEEASREDRARSRRDIPELESELELLTAPAGGRAKGAGQ